MAVRPRNGVKAWGTVTRAPPHIISCMRLHTILTRGATANLNSVETLATAMFTGDSCWEKLNLWL